MARLNCSIAKCDKTESDVCIKTSVESDETTNCMKTGMQDRKLVVRTQI